MQDFWKNIQVNKKPINGKKEKFKAVIFNFFFSLAGVINNIKTPKIGENKIKASIFSNNII